MASVKSTVMIGGIIALMLTLQVSCNAIFKKIEAVDSTQIDGIIKLTSTLQVSNNDNDDPALLTNTTSLIRGRGKDYYASTYKNDWKSAATDCKSEGFKFAFMRSDADRNVLTDLIRHMGWLETSFWIGGCSNVWMVHCPHECTEIAVNFFNHQWNLEVNHGVQCWKKNRFICEL